MYFANDIMRLVGAFSPSAAIQANVNILAIICDCGVSFVWPSHVSLAECPGCQKRELWHDVEPKPATGPWSEPVMRQP
jgi:hypothetical protein